MSKIDYQTRKQVYIDAIEKYGHANQTIKAIEEMSELTKELCKLLNQYTETTMDKIADEIADVTVTLEQLRIMYDINKEVCEHMDLKVERLSQRVYGAAE